MCEVSVQLREVGSNPFDLNTLNTKIWMLGLGHQPDILTNNSEPCLKDAKGDGEAVEQVIWKQEKGVDHQEPESRTGQK